MTTPCRADAARQGVVRSVILEVWHAGRVERRRAAIGESA